MYKDGVSIHMIAGRGMLKNILQILACFVIGLLGIAFAFVPYLGLPLSALAFVAGFTAALPTLIFVISVFAIFRKSVLRHLLCWSLGAPFLVTSAYLALNWPFIRSSANSDWSSYYSYTGGEAALVFACASIAAVLFWFLNRRASRRVRAATDHGTDEPMKSAAT